MLARLGIPAAGIEEAGPSAGQCLITNWDAPPNRREIYQLDETREGKGAPMSFEGSPGQTG
jgi:hypothetical protein